MTAQIPENIFYQGEKCKMCTEPLEDYFSQGGIRPDFRPRHTALWRCYVGSWEIVKDHLYLVGLEGWLEDGTEVTVEMLFPGSPNKVFAQWYSGTLYIPQGELLVNIHRGYESIYERDLLLDVQSGVVVATTVRHNEIAAV